ncbi:enhanced serine sensitivity protein SseB [Streptomyces bambusae]|uniref:Enhanced serine sensitivity protein SseB n=1 Tax=Streptomyces bambusae TaxID=1550616 RepID=A0ABS6ZDA6_9ACTN|nr:enhanced serine sensitivity protein SseB [Streptomyces bambusae]MBW5485566.1 enhanced serine sensitivity protein SseB [Streptomyces bambusae]
MHGYGEGYSDGYGQGHGDGHGDGNGSGSGWPANELEAVLGAALGHPDAGGRILEVLGRSHLWVPLPAGGGPDSPGGLTLPTMDIGGAAYVPVYSSEAQFRTCVGVAMDFAVAPAVEFARGLPPQLGIAVNPEGAVGVPLPPPAVAELCRAGRTPLDGPASGGRVRLFEPDWQDDPVDFLSAAAEEFRATGVVASAHRCLASVEGGDPELYIGVRLATGAPDGAWGSGPDMRNLPMDALGRALGRVRPPWPVQLVLLDATEDPVADWLSTRVRPFYIP